MGFTFDPIESGNSEAMEAMLKAAGACVKGVGVHLTTESAPPTLDTCRMAGSDFGYVTFALPSGREVTYYVKGADDALHMAGLWQEAAVRLLAASPPPAVTRAGERAAAAVALEPVAEAAS